MHKSRGVDALSLIIRFLSVVMFGYFLLKIYF